MTALVQEVRSALTSDTHHNAGPQVGQQSTVNVVGGKAAQGAFTATCTRALTVGFTKVCKEKKKLQHCKNQKWPGIWILPPPLAP